MKSFYFFLLVLLGSTRSFAQVNLPYFENFDELHGWNNNTSNQNWLIIDSMAVLNSATTSGFISFQSPLFNTASVPNPAFQFDVKIITQSGCYPEFQLTTSANGGVSNNWGTEITVVGQTCSSSDIQISNNTWETIEVFNLPQVNNYRLILRANFFGGSGIILIDNVELNTRDSLSINAPEPPPPHDTTTTAIQNPTILENVYFSNRKLVLNPSYLQHRLVILNSLGQIAFETNIERETSVDLHTLTPGMYFIRIFNQDNEFMGTKKIFIQ